jgi:predicted nucleic acid-binding protein
VAAYVLDASVIAALYVDDPASAESDALLERLGGQGAELHAPDLLLLEVANVLWKRVRRGELVAADAMTAIVDLSVAAIRLHPAGLLVRSALGLALAHGLTAYDAAYVALAARIGGVVVSNDATMRRRAAEAGLPVAAPAEVR